MMHKVVFLAGGGPVSGLQTKSKNTTKNTTKKWIRNSAVAAVVALSSDVAGQDITDGYSCGNRVAFLIRTYGQSATQACQQVGDEFPAVCGPHAPSPGPPDHSPTEDCFCVFEAHPGIACSGRDELGTEYGHTVASAHERCLEQPTCVSWETNGEKYWFSDSCVLEYATSHSGETLYIKTIQGDAACVQNAVCPFNRLPSVCWPRPPSSGGQCGDHIERLIGNGQSMNQACQQVGNEFPAQCGACAPETPTDSQTEDCFCVFEGMPCSGRNELGTEYGHTVASAKQKCLEQPTCVSWETNGEKYWFSESCVPKYATLVIPGETLYIKIIQGDAACVQSAVCPFLKSMRGMPGTHVRPAPDPNVVRLGGNSFDPEQWSAGLAAGGVDGLDLSDKPFYPEIYYDGEYHPICGIGLNDEAAATACRGVDRFTESTKDELDVPWIHQERFTYGGRVVKTNVVLERDAMPVGACLEGESLDGCTAGGNAFGDFTALDGRCKKGNPVGVQIVCQRQCRKFGQRVYLEENRHFGERYGLPTSPEMVSYLEVCAPFVKNTTTYYLEDLTALVDHPIYGNFITQFSSLLDVMGQRCSANVLELICHTVFKECKPVDVEDPLTGGVANVMLPSLLCKTECERHKTMWDQCYANIQKDAADMELFVSNMEAMSQLMSDAHKKVTGHELPTGPDGARSPFSLIDCDAKGGRAADDIPDEEVAASWILGRYPQTHFQLGGVSGLGVIGWAFPRFMSSEMLYPETSSTYTGPDGVSYEVPCTIPGQADAFEVTCSPPFTKSILPETNRACVHVCPVGQFSMEEYTTMWAVFVGIGMLSFVLNLFMLATWKLAGRRQFRATPFQLKSCVFWGLLYGIVETIPTLILKYDLPCTHPTEEEIGSSWLCHVNRSSFFLLLGITVNLCALTIIIFRGISGLTVHALEKKTYVNVLSTAVPLLFTAIAYVLDTSEQDTENYHLNVSRHSFNCSMRFSTMVEEWLVLWLPFCVSCILTTVCSIVSWWKIGDIQLSLGTTRPGASRVQSEGQKTLAGQRRRLIRIAAMVSVCLLLSVSLVGQATVEQAAWTDYEEKKLDCLIKTGGTRNFQDYGFNKKDIVEDVCPVHDEHLCSTLAKERHLAKYHGQNPAVTCGWYPHLSTNSFMCNTHTILPDEWAHLVTCECPCSYLSGKIVERPSPVAMTLSFAAQALVAAIVALNLGFREDNLRLWKKFQTNELNKSFTQRWKRICQKHVVDVLLIVL